MALRDIASSWAPSAWVSDEESPSRACKALITSMKDVNSLAMAEESCGAYNVEINSSDADRRADDLSEKESSTRFGSLGE